MDGKMSTSSASTAKNTGSFDHGYAVTSHSFQGLTAGRVIVNIDTDSAWSLINTRLAYVSISRASTDARVYTNNAESLGERLATDITKTAAWTSARPARPSKRVRRSRRRPVSWPRATGSALPPPTVRTASGPVTSPPSSGSVRTTPILPG